MWKSEMEFHSEKPEFTSAQKWVAENVTVVNDKTICDIKEDDYTEFPAFMG